MTEKKIKLNATNEVQEFVNAASKCNFDINLHYQRAIVDAKSFLGVLSLGLSKIFTVSYGGNDGNFRTDSEQVCCCIVRIHKSLKKTEIYTGGCEKRIVPQKRKTKSL